MMLKCDWCGMITDSEDCGWRLAREEDGVMQGTHLMTCPSCGSSELYEVNEMSVDLWAWREECDTHKCCGDCDLCDYAEEDEEDDECN